MSRRTNLVIGLVAMASFVAMAMLILSGNATEEKPIATVETPQNKAIEWVDDPTLDDRGVVEMKVKPLQSDPLSWVYFDVSWEDTGKEACGVPLTGREIRCEFAPAVYTIEPGTKLTIDVMVVDFNGRIVQILSTKEIRIPGRSATLVRGAVALLIGTAMFLAGVVFYRRRRG